ncbi:MAG TPA: hypothetical protein VNS32_04060 [Flavisolibacter sp.]|nr:hypothetical protein [Flavisolibacter sp.]
MRGLLVFILCLIQFLIPVRTQATDAFFKVQYATQKLNSQQLEVASVGHHESAEISNTSLFIIAHTAKVRNLHLDKCFLSALSISLPNLLRNDLACPERSSPQQLNFYPTYKDFNT